VPLVGVLAGTTTTAPLSSRAQGTAGGVLAECAALSPLFEELHTCLDNYLDVMDDNIADVAAYVERTLEGEARTAFAVAQQSFALYRRDNCLWYLAFSTPRDEAELLAKDCLATMSMRRLSELQRLIAADEDDEAVRNGYYVYGANRNTFRSCGSEARYWVEGEAGVVGELQQTYLDATTEPLQVLFASLRGTLEEGVEAPSGHDGVLQAKALIELRMPREADCRLPATESPPAVEVAAATSTDLPTAAVPPVSEPVAAPAQPDQELIAYFGAWLAACAESDGEPLCTLSVALDPVEGGGEAGESTPQLSLRRRAAAITVLELEFPGREIDSPAKLRWSIDEQVLGDIVGSTVRVDERSARQLVETPRYLQTELLPLMIDGGRLEIELLESVDDERGERFRATLIGLTRALAFADDFVRDGSGL